MTDDDRFDEFVKSAIQDLDPVPPVPRDEMWAGIEQARRFRRNTKQRRAVPVWTAWGVGLAAMLAVGIGLGRWSMRDQQPAELPLVEATPADHPADSRTGEIDNTFVRLPLNERKAVDFSRERRLERDVTPEPAPAQSSNTAYQLVAVQHLSRAEVLLTSIGTGSIDDQVMGWAKDMLSTTRLLLDSPAASDPRMARLLEDLELILAQIASPAAQSQRELDMIQQGIKQTGVLPRLRAAVPAGTAIGI